MAEGVGLVMTVVDIGILAALSLSAIVGLWYGLLNVLFSVVAWGAAALVAVRFHDRVSPWLEGYLEPLPRDVVAGAGVFIASLLIFSVLGHFFLKLLDRTGLGAVNRLLGGCFGLGLGAVAVAVLVFLAGFTTLPGRGWWQEAVLVEPFQRVSTWARGLLPADLAAHHRYEPAKPLSPGGRGAG